MAPPPPGLGAARSHSHVLAWWGAAGRSWDYAQAAQALMEDVNWSLETQSNQKGKGTVARYSEALERAADLGLSRQEIIQVCQDIIADRGQEMGEENPQAQPAGNAGATGEAGGSAPIKTRTLSGYPSDANSPYNENGTPVSFWTGARQGNSGDTASPSTNRVQENERTVNNNVL